MSEKAGPGVGFEFPSYEVSWLKRDLLLFAASIGATYPEELHFLYVSFLYELDSNLGREFKLTASLGTAPPVRRLPYIPHYSALQTH